MPSSQKELCKNLDGFAHLKLNLMGYGKAAAVGNMGEISASREAIPKIGLLPIQKVRKQIKSWCSNYSENLKSIRIVFLSSKPHYGPWNFSSK